VPSERLAPLADSRSRRAVLRKASALEYKIQRRALRKEDFINYIQVGCTG